MSQQTCSIVQIVNAGVTLRHVRLSSCTSKQEADKFYVVPGSKASFKTMLVAKTTHIEILANKTQELSKNRSSAHQCT